MACVPMLQRYLSSPRQRLGRSTAFEQCGELSAAVELRRLFPGITDNAKARECAWTIAGWKPLPLKLRSVSRVPHAISHRLTAGVT